MGIRALETFAAAEHGLRSGQYSAALKAYLQVVQGVPDFWRARLRIADTLLNLKGRPQALEVYKAIAWQAVKAGQPLSALVAIKMATALDPAQREAIEVMAELYCQGSDRLGATEAPARRHLGKDDSAAEAVPEQGDALMALAADVAADTRGLPPASAQLPAIPLFSFLDQTAFAAVLGSLQLRRFVKGDTVIEEGQPGEAFYLLAEGDVEVSRQGTHRPVTLAKLHPGAVFGEMALISRAPRAATVTALDDCDLLELKRSALENRAPEVDSVTMALKSFTRERFLTNLTATSPVFKPFPRPMRIEITKKFRDLTVSAGEAVISEGEAGKGLFLIMRGEFEVTKRDRGERTLLARLKEGDVFGEIALIEESPTTATVAASIPAEVLYLPKKEFASTMARNPEFKHELRKLTVERLAKNRERLENETIELIEDDDLIMV